MLATETHANETTRDRIAAWRKRDRHATAAEMARSLGVSCERVRQLLAVLGLPARPPSREAVAERNREALATLDRVTDVLATMARKLAMSGGHPVHGAATALRSARDDVRSAVASLR